MSIGRLRSAIIKVVIDGSCSEHMSVNAGVLQVCVLSLPLFLLHINAMLEDSSLHCYADIAQWTLLNLYLQLRHPSGLTVQYVTNSSTVHTIWICGAPLRFCRNSFHELPWPGLGIFKNCLYLRLKGRQRTFSSSGVTRGRGQQ